MILFHLQEIRKEFLLEHPNDDHKEEEALIEALEAKKTKSVLSVEEHELAMQPHKAGDYHWPWDAYQAVCWLFNKELNALDKSTRDHMDKATFGKRMKTAHEWFNGLSKQKKREAELAAK
jgi:hypothetical protein